MSQQLLFVSLNGNRNWEKTETLTNMGSVLKPFCLQAESRGTSIHVLLQGTSFVTHTGRSSVCVIGKRSGLPAYVCVIIYLWFRQIDQVEIQSRNRHVPI